MATFGLNCHFEFGNGSSILNDLKTTPILSKLAKQLLKYCTYRRLMLIMLLMQIAQQVSIRQFLNAGDQHCTFLM